MKMNVTKKCIYCSQEEVEPFYINGDIKYLHCFCCKRSYTLKEALEFLKLSAPEQMYYRYTKIIQKGE